MIGTPLDGVQNENVRRLLNVAIFNGSLTGSEKSELLSTLSQMQGTEFQQTVEEVRFLGSQSTPSELAALYRALGENFLADSDLIRLAVRAREAELTDEELSALVEVCFPGGCIFD